MGSEIELSEFLQNLSLISHHHKNSESVRSPLVFWSEYEGYECNSSSSSCWLLFPYNCYIYDLV
ncbi:hypothetical protein Hanom_Chr11g01027451 [Helianthus anomalus]